MVRGKTERDDGDGGEMRLECIKDVIMNITSDKAFTAGLTYEGYYYTDPNSFDKTLFSKNNFGIRHHIRDYLDSGDDEFFDKHFKIEIVEESNHFDKARELLPLSNCLKRHHACVIVKGGLVIAKGYNESPEACITCARMDIEHNAGSYDDCAAVHAEVSALIKAKVDLGGAELYLVCSDEVDPIPCPACQKLLDWTGVKQVREVQG